MLLRMIRVRRWLSAASLGLLVAVCFLWRRSDTTVDGIGCALSSTEEVSISSGMGVIVMSAYSYEGGSVERFHCFSIPATTFRRHGPERNLYNRGFSFWPPTRLRPPNEAALTLTSVSFPHWVLVVVLSLLPLHWYWMDVLCPRRRRTRGLCVKCGYDLTGASKCRCPECGTPFDAAGSIAM